MIFWVADSEDLALALILLALSPCSRLSECGAVLAGVKAKPSGWPFGGSGPALTPAPGDAIKGSAGSREGEWLWRGLAMGWFRRSGAVLIFVFPYFVGKQLVVERIFEYNRGMQLGDSCRQASATERSPLDEALDDLRHSRHRPDQHNGNRRT